MYRKLIVGVVIIVDPAALSVCGHHSHFNYIDGVVARIPFVTKAQPECASV